MVYTKLNKNLNELQNSTHTTTRKKRQMENTERTASSFQLHIRIKNLTNIWLSKEEIKILGLGFQHSFEKAPQAWMCDLAIDTDTAISVVTQDTYRYLACKKIKQILNCKSQSDYLHKRQIYIYLNSYVISYKCKMPLLYMLKKVKWKVHKCKHLSGLPWPISNFTQWNIRPHPDPVQDISYFPSVHVKKGKG